MKPLAANRLVLSRKQHRACTLSISRAELEQRLGPPLAIDDEGDGLGARYRWEYQGECGLEVLIDLPRESGAREAVLWMKHLEVEHALEHLGLSTEHVLWRADMMEPLPLDGWAVVRQDGAGNQFDICVLSVPDHAECLAQLLETRSPEQAYATELRGLKPAPRRTPSRSWALPSHDEHTASL